LTFEYSEHNRTERNLLYKLGKKKVKEKIQTGKKKKKIEFENHSRKIKIGQ